MIVAGAAPAAEGTVVYVPCIGTGLDPEMDNAILVRVEMLK